MKSILSEYLYSIIRTRMEVLEEMDLRNLRGLESELDVPGIIDLIGLDRIIEAVGKNKLIQKIGPEKVLEIVSRHLTKERIEELLDKNTKGD